MSRKQLIVVKWKAAITSSPPQIPLKPLLTAQTLWWWVQTVNRAKNSSRVRAGGGSSLQGCSGNTFTQRVPWFTRQHVNWPLNINQASLSVGLNNRLLSTVLLLLSNQTCSGTSLPVWKMSLWNVTFSLSRFNCRGNPSSRFKPLHRTRDRFQVFGETKRMNDPVYLWQIRTNQPYDLWPFHIPVL